MAQRKATDTPDSTDASGTRYYYCRGPAHTQPALLPARSFRTYQRRRPDGSQYRYRQRRCRACRYLYDRGQRGVGFGYQQHGKVPLVAMRPYLEELEARCGSAASAAKAVGTSRVMFLAWQGRSRWHARKNPIRNMYATSAAKVLEALQAKRQEQQGQVVLFELHTSHPQLVGRCLGCGASEENYTTGCRSCIARRATRKARSDGN